MIKESIKDLIIAIAEGDSIAIEDSFNTVIASKISDRLDDMRVDVAQGMFGSVDESLEDYSVELEEDTIEKVKVPVGTRPKGIGWVLHKAGEQSGADHSIYKRKTRAVAAPTYNKEELTLEDYSVEELEDFMMSEEFEQLDELSQKTLTTYIHKAAPEGTALDSLPNKRQKGVLLALQKKYPNVTFKGNKVKVPSTNEEVDLDEAREERGDMGVERSPNGSCRGSSQHSMDLAKQSGYTHAVMHSGTKGGIDTYHTTKAGAEKRLAAVRKKHGIPEYSTRARIAEL